MKSGLCGTGQGWRLVILMVSGFVLGWAHTAQRGVEAAVVPPVNPLQSGQLDLLDAAPGSAAFDQLGLEQPIDCLGECVIKAVPAAADRADDAELGEPVGVAHRQILGGFNRSSQHLDRGGADGATGGMDDDGDRAAGDAVAGATASSAGE